LELTGVAANGEDSILLLEPAPINTAENIAGEPTPARFHLPAPDRTSERVLEIKGEDLNFLADLPLFELA
jgi:hypothetical protein